MKSAGDPNRPKPDPDVPKYEIETERLLFRRMLESDCESLHEVYASHDAMTYMCAVPHPRSWQAPLTMAACTQVTGTPCRYCSDHIFHRRNPIPRSRRRLLLHGLPEIILACPATATHRHDWNYQGRNRVRPAPGALEERGRQRGNGGVLEKLLGSVSGGGMYNGRCGSEEQRELEAAREIRFRGDGTRKQHFWHPYWPVRFGLFEVKQTYDSEWVGWYGAVAGVLRITVMPLFESCQVPSDSSWPARDIT